jgi:hypothetical protein
MYGSAGSLFVPVAWARDWNMELFAGLTNLKHYIRVHARNVCAHKIGIIYRRTYFAYYVLSSDPEFFPTLYFGR